MQAPAARPALQRRAASRVLQCLHERSARLGEPQAALVFGHLPGPPDRFARAPEPATRNRIVSRGRASASAGVGRVTERSGAQERRHPVARFFECDAFFDGALPASGWAAAAGRWSSSFAARAFTGPGFSTTPSDSDKSSARFDHLAGPDRLGARPPLPSVSRATSSASTFLSTASRTAVRYSSGWRAGSKGPVSWLTRSSASLSSRGDASFVSGTTISVRRDKLLGEAHHVEGEEIVARPKQRQPRTGTDLHLGEGDLSTLLEHGSKQIERRGRSSSGAHPVALVDVREVDLERVDELRDVNPAAASVPSISRAPPSRRARTRPSTPRTPCRFRPT